MSVRDISVSYRDGGLSRSYEFRLDELAGGAPEGLPMQVAFRGSYQDQPFSLSLEGDPFAEFMDPTSPWSLELSGDVVDTPVRVSGTAYPEADGRGAELEIELGQLTKRSARLILVFVEHAERAGGRAETERADRRVAGEEQPARRQVQSDTARRVPGHVQYPRPAVEIDLVAVLELPVHSRGLGWS